MVNVLDEKDVKHNRVVRYQALAKAWQKKWEGALYHSQKLQQLWISGYYNKGYSRWHLINLMNRAVSAGIAYLAEGNPKVLIEPVAPSLRSYAYGMRLITNFLVEKYNFAENVLTPGAIASYFGAAIARTFTEYDRCVSIGNEKIKVGTPKVAIIEPCDYTGDPSVKVRADFAFEGDLYRLPTDYAKDLFARKDKYGKQIADFITADANLDSKYSATEITFKDGYDFNKLALDEYSTFIDIYNYKEKTIETIMPMGHKAVVIKTIDSKFNPYDYLGYKYPPNCPIPIPPAWDIYDLDENINLVAKSEREKAEAHKTIIAAEPTGKKAAEAVLKGKNMDVITVKGMDGVKQFSFGGVSSEGLSWIQWAEQEFQKAGSTSSDIVSGRGPSSDTLGQDQLIFSNATRMINGYYTKFHNWEESILRKWVNVTMDNPSTYVKILNTVKIPGLGDFEYPVYYSKADKVADFSQLVLKVVPYSTQRMTPEMKYQRLIQLMTTWIMPTLQLRREQGADIDLQMVDRLIADYGGFDEFPQWYKSAIPPDGPDVNYIMKTEGNKSKNPGQLNDSTGALDVSRLANSQGYDMRNGVGAERNINQEQTKGITQ
jgi:hypothetical protein